jgi:predicted nucleotidyltransferase
MIFKEPVLKALSTEKKARIVEYFLSDPPRMSEREIAQGLNISHMTVNRSVNELFAMNFLKVARAGRVNLWELNEGSFSHKVLRKALAGDGSAAHPQKELIKTLQNGLKGSRAIKVMFYGSIQKGTENPGSDVDLLIVAGDEKAKKQLDAALTKLEKECLRLYGNPLSAIVLTKEEYKKSRGQRAIKDAEKGIKII